MPINGRPRSASSLLAFFCCGALSTAIYAIAFAAFPAPAMATQSCDLYASPSGNDANTGTTPGTALASPITLLNRIAAGQVGCLEDGANFVLGGGAAITATGGTLGSPKTLRPTTAGARATITTATGLWLQSASHDLMIQDLDIRRSAATGGSLFLVDGDRITLTGLDLSYPANICLDVGPDSRNGATDPASDFMLLNSRVHDCGSQYGAPHFPNDSGVHGIYLQFLRDGADADGYSAIIRNNVIDHNHNRGIQLYPDVKDTSITRNVLYANGANLNLGSEPASNLYSTDNTITDNVIAEAVLDGRTPGGFVGDTAEVLGNFPAGSPLTNHVDNNCVANTAYPDHLYEGYGFTHVDNIENQPPVFVDAPGGDYRQTAASPCLGTGLEQSSLPGQPTVTSSTPSAGAMTVAFNPPANNGGSPISRYTSQCVSTDGGVVGFKTGSSTPLQVTNLTATKNYHCRVRAINAVGAGPYGPYGATLTLPPAAAPGSPAVTSSTPSAGAMTVAFNPPTNNGGSPITRYTSQCVSTDGGVVGFKTGSSTPLQVTNLTATKNYHCRVRAINAVGAGPYGPYGATLRLP